MNRVETIGRATLYLGDCRDILPTLGKVDAVVTDPPYNFSTASSGGKHALWADAVNSAFWFSEIFRLCRQRLQGHGAIWWFLNWKTFIPLQKAVWDADLKFDSLLVWDKEWIGPGGVVGLRPSYELVAFIAEGEFKLPNRGLPDIWRSKWSSQRESGHPAEKPVHLMRKIIDETPAPVVLDPFMGSGTTGVAAVQAQRDFVGIEMDERYFDIACRRVEDAQRQKDLFVDEAAA